MKKVISVAAALAVAASMAVSVFAAGSVTTAVEVEVVSNQVETTYVTEDGTVETGAVEIEVVTAPEVLADAVEVAAVEEVAGEDATCLTVLEVNAVVGGEEVEITESTPIETKVTIPTNATVQIVAYNESTGAWVKIDATYNYATKSLNFVMEPEYSKIAITTVPNKGVSGWFRTQLNNLRRGRN
jgi:hypothetical protein